ncbi:hypothetical protein GCM10027168_44410 [Streptomyces capparidis]
MPQKRPGRTRTKRTNGRKPLLLSELPADSFNVRAGEQKTIVCPDCRTWRRIMGETTLKIREHCISDRVADGEKHVRCDGSNQLVVVDIDVRHWQARQDRLFRDAVPARARRAARQHSKPMPPPAPPVDRILPPATSAEQVRQAYADHVDGCVVCIGESEYCPAGERLLIVFLKLLEKETGRRHQPGRAKQWQAVLPSVQRAETQRRAQLSAHTAPPAEGPDLPRQPLCITR